MKNIKVLIADDSVVYRSQIRAALSSLKWVEIVGAASNGRLALERIQQTHVDLLILDLEMPEMDGLATLAEISAKGIKCKVLVFSSISKRGAESTLEALRLGASDFITKPGSSDGKDAAAGDPSERIRLVLEPKISALFPDVPDGVGLSALPGPSGPAFPKVIWELFNPQIVVIGSSTGGPTVLENLFSELAAPLRCPILIAQHMPPIFTTSLAERLERLSGIPTREAVHGMALDKQTAYIAPGDFHMTVSGTKETPTLALDRGPLINSVRPAVDPLFASAARIFREKCLGIVLTGMGADGKVGAEKIKQSGGAVVIQNQISCVVFGMPGAVMAAGAYDLVLSPNEIARALQEKVAQRKSNEQTLRSIGGQ